MAPSGFGQGQLIDHTNVGLQGVSRAAKALTPSPSADHQGSMGQTPFGGLRQCVLPLEREPTRSSTNLFGLFFGSELRAGSCGVWLLHRFKTIKLQLWQQGLPLGLDC